MDSVLSYILAFAAVTMAVVFGFRSWMLSKRERSSRHLRRSGSRQHRDFSRRSSRHSSGRSRHSSSSRRFNRGERGSDYPRDRSSRGEFRGGNNSPAGPEDSSSSSR